MTASGLCDLPHAAPERESRQPLQTPVSEVHGERNHTLAGNSSVHKTIKSRCYGSGLIRGQIANYTNRIVIENG